MGERGARGYHPLLCFLSESKLLLNSWFRPGSAYTSNGILDFMNETLSALPEAIKIHRLYGERSESENWIEQAKNGLCAGRTITRDFWVNDILWQLSQPACKIAV